MQPIQCKGLACCRQVTQLAWAAAGAHLQRGGGVVRARAARAADQGGALPDQPAVLAYLAAPAARVRPVRALLLSASLLLYATVQASVVLQCQKDSMIRCVVFWLDQPAVSPLLRHLMLAYKRTAPCRPSRGSPAEFMMRALCPQTRPLQSFMVGDGSAALLFRPPHEPALPTQPGVRARQAPHLPAAQLCGGGRQRDAGGRAHHPGDLPRGRHEPGARAALRAGRGQRGRLPPLPGAASKPENPRYPGHHKHGRHKPSAPCCLPRWMRSVRLHLTLTGAASMHPFCAKAASVHNCASCCRLTACPMFFAFRLGPTDAALLVICNPLEYLGALVRSTSAPVG